MFACACVLWRRRDVRVCAWLRDGSSGRGSEMKDGCGRRGEMPELMPCFSGYSFFFLISFSDLIVQ